MGETVGSSLAQAARDGEAVHVGKHDVEHGEVELPRRGEGEPFAAGAGDGDVETGELHARGEQFADVGVVLDDEDACFGRAHACHSRPPDWAFAGSRLEKVAPTMGRHAAARTRS